MIIVKGKMKLSFLDIENSVIKQCSLNKNSEINLIEPESIFRIHPNSQLYSKTLGETVGQ